MIKDLARLAVLLACSFAFVPVALAADTASTVSIPWGDWLVALLAYFQPAVITFALALVTWAVAKIGGPIGDLIKAAITEQTLSRAVDYALGAVNGAAKGKVLDLTTSNAVLGQAEAYVIANAPALASKLGELLLPKLYARLSAAGVLPPDATATLAGAALPKA